MSDSKACFEKYFRQALDQGNVKLENFWTCLLCERLGKRVNIKQVLKHGYKSIKNHGDTRKNIIYNKIIYLKNRSWWTYQCFK